MNTGYNITDVFMTVGAAIALAMLVGSTVAANCPWVIAGFTGLALAMMVITRHLDGNITGCYYQRMQATTSINYPNWVKMAGILWL